MSCSKCNCTDCTNYRQERESQKTCSCGKKSVCLKLEGSNLVGICKEHAGL